MAGIIKQAMGIQQPDQDKHAPSAPESQQPAGTQSSPAAEGGLAGAPGTDDAVSRIVAAGQLMLYDKNGFGSVVQQLRANPDDPASAIADVTFTLMTALDEKSRGTLPEDALIPAASMLLEEVAGIARDAGVAKVDDTTVARAMQALVSLAIEHGMIDEADIQAAMGEMDPQELQQVIAEQEQLAGGAAAATGVPSAA